MVQRHSYDHCFGAKLSTRYLLVLTMTSVAQLAFQEKAVLAESGAGREREADREAAL